ncbi:MAG: hypothetical protein AAGG51_09610 [Cyanobacteria bacterium P01_G01_bin.54]
MKKGSAYLTTLLMAGFGSAIFQVGAVTQALEKPLQTAQQTRQSSVNAPTEVCINYRVSQEYGLEIYTSDDPRSSSVLDYVFPAEKVRYVEVSERENVEWLRIVAPVEGWIENGILGSADSNTSPCGELGISYGVQR